MLDIDGGRTVCKELGGVLLLGETGFAAGPEISKAHVIPVRSPCLVLMDQDVTSQQLLQKHAFLLAAMLVTMMITDATSQTVSPSELFLL